MSDVEMETAEASAEAPVTETDYTAEMAQTFDRLNPRDELAKVRTTELKSRRIYSDYYNASERTNRINRSSADRRNSATSI